MKRQSDYTSPERFDTDREIDQTLRPLTFEDFVGQGSITSNLQIFIKAARQRKEALDHVLLTGPPGLGKTTLAYIIANEMNTNIKITSGPILERPGDLAGILTSLSEGDVLFIDEIHRLNHTVEEYLYPAMEEFRIDILIDRGPNARSVQLKLPRFTLVGATTRAGLLTAPLRSRFGITNRLDYYNRTELFRILKRSANILTINANDEGLQEIAGRSRGTPRIANRLLRRCRDFAEVETKFKRNNGVITKEVADYALEKLEVDEYGLDEMDKRILLAIVDKYSGGPVGLNTLSVTVGEEAGTIEEVYEPYLIREGFLKRTSRGREVTDIVYKHFNRKRKATGTSNQLPLIDGM